MVSWSRAFVCAQGSFSKQRLGPELLKRVLPGATSVLPCHWTFAGKTRLSTWRQFFFRAQYQIPRAQGQIPLIGSPFNGRQFALWLCLQICLNPTLGPHFQIPLIFAPSEIWLFFRCAVAQIPARSPRLSPTELGTLPDRTDSLMASPTHPDALAQTQPARPRSGSTNSGTL